MNFHGVADQLITRREAARSLGLLGASAVLGGGTMPAYAAPGASVGAFADPTANLRAWVKMWGDLDPAHESLNWFSGHIFAVQSGKALRKLFGFDVLAAARFEMQPDDSVRMFSKETIFYKDAATDQVMDAWYNPITDEQVEVVHNHNKVVNLQIKPVTPVKVDGKVVEIPFQQPWWTFGDQAFSLSEVHVVFPNPMTPREWPRESAGETVRVTEIFHRICSLQAIQDENTTAVDYAGAWTRLGPWPHWMLMGQAEGHILMRAYLKKLASDSQVPNGFRAEADKRYPGYLSAPAQKTWGMPNETDTLNYMAERQPRR
jgi:hypothetical protein